MDDLDRLIMMRDAREPGYAKRFERESSAFRVGVQLQVAREQAGLTQQQVAERMGTKKSAISRLENNAGDMRLSTLQRYAEAVGHRLVIDIAGLEEEAKPAAVRKPRKSRKLMAADTQS
jgi:transcriptional regulator with XRE-family HTH domain